jgi:hypothetical protein
MEHRWGQRFSVDIPVRIILSRGVVVWGRLRDLSVTGAFLECIHPLPVSALVSVESRQSPLTVGAAASVVRAEAGGAGLEWCEPWEGISGLLSALQPARSRARHVGHRSNYAEGGARTTPGYRPRAFCPVRERHRIPRRNQPEAK